MDDEDGFFGERVAATYDDSSDIFGPGVVDAVADVLAGLAGGGRALELGIGTGRDAAARALGGLDPAALHQREPSARLGLGETRELTASQPHTPRPDR